FKEFLEKASDSEKSTLRLEVDKMKRSETEWLQVTTGILDHVFALQQAAARSGQPELAHQISLFQRACRDLARRIGLVPFAPEENQPFDPNLHHLADAESGGEKGGPIARILATGYTYQGQLVRRSLVSLTASPGKTASAKPATQEAATQAESSPQTSQSVSVADDLPDLSIAEINAKAQKRPATDSGPTSQDSLLL
ncbi:MAG TPA: nucleotide exchange factor GrpE, partial [Candidatus Paceibacterota bacterium]|nr:nucleotide exchange factor GrpE [Candidatus Paceibacterota bacterium]